MYFLTVFSVYLTLLIWRWTAVSNLMALTAVVSNEWPVESSELRTVKPY